MNPVSVWLGTASPQEWLTNVSSLLATAMLFLVIYGFRRYIKRPHIAPIDSPPVTGQTRSRVSHRQYAGP